VAQLSSRRKGGVFGPVESFRSGHSFVLTPATRQRLFFELEATVQDAFVSAAVYIIRRDVAKSFVIPRRARPWIGGTRKGMPPVNRASAAAARGTLKAEGPHEAATFFFSPAGRVPLPVSHKEYGLPQEGGFKTQR
jgi:hypothetical protein